MGSLFLIRYENLDGFRKNTTRVRVGGIPHGHVTTRAIPVELVAIIVRITRMDILISTIVDHYFDREDLRIR